MTIDITITVDRSDAAALVEPIRKAMSESRIDVPIETANLNDEGLGDITIYMAWDNFMNAPVPSYCKWIEGKDNVILSYERKTLTDAIGSWHGSAGVEANRLDRQVFDLMANDDISFPFLIIEGGYVPNHMRKHLGALRLHLARLNAECLPVMFTGSKNETARYIVRTCERLAAGSFGVFDRPVRLVKMDTPHLSMICGLPDVKESIGKKIMEQFSSFGEFYGACVAHSIMMKAITNKAQVKRESPLMQIDGIGRTKADQIAMFMVGKW